MKGGIAIAKTKSEIQRDYEKRSNYAAQKKYDAENVKKYSFKCVKHLDGDIIDKLEEQGSKSAYIKDLIRADIYRTKK